MEATLSGTIASGVVAVPSDYLDIKFAYIIDSTTKTRLKKTSGGAIYDSYTLRAADAKPTHIGREGTNFIFGPYPDSNYSIAGIYYAKPTIIATSANALFTANPDLYLFATLAECAPYMMDDPRAALWDAKYNSIKQQMDFEDNQESSGGGGMAVRTV